MNQFKIGQTVRWTSQANGSRKTKEGSVVAVIPARTHISSTALTVKVKDPGLPRDHESYVVQVGKKGYWPRVSALELVFDVGDASPVVKPPVAEQAR